MLNSAIVLLCEVIGKSFYWINNILGSESRLKEEPQKLGRLSRGAVAKGSTNKIRVWPLDPKIS